MAKVTQTRAYRHLKPSQKRGEPTRELQQVTRSLSTMFPMDDYSEFSSAISGPGRCVEHFSWFHPLSIERITRGKLCIFHVSSIRRLRLTLAFSPTILTSDIENTVKKWLFAQPTTWMIVASMVKFRLLPARHRVQDFRMPFIQETW
jgi:hypothetical protein